MTTTQSTRRVNYGNYPGEFVIQFDVGKTHHSESGFGRVQIGREGNSGLEAFIARAIWNTDYPTPLEEWQHKKVQVFVGEGSGQSSTPFSISPETFSAKCEEFRFSKIFLQRLVAKAPLFENRFEFSTISDTAAVPSHLEIAMANFENDAFFCLLRYDFRERSSKALLLLKTMDYLKEASSSSKDILPWFDSRKAILGRHPLMILNVILEFIQQKAHQYVRWRLELYGLESRLGVTRYIGSLRQAGYDEVDHDFALLNADLASLAKRLADTELSASTILEHSKSIHRLVGYCEQYEAIIAVGQSKSLLPIVSEQNEEIQGTIIRAELYLRNMKMAQDVLQSLSAVLYNRINKQDTDSMKTIAVVTLVFLPATFVSAIFSTGIFNFHASDPADQPRTVSKYGWVYLLLCVLSTTLTLVSWVCWYRWGRVWLEKLKLTKMDSSSKRPAT